MSELAIERVDVHLAARSGRERRIVFWTLVLSVVTALALVSSAPGWGVFISWLSAVAVVVAWYRPVLGVASVLSLTLLFEQYEYASFRPITLEVPLFDNVSHFTPLTGVDANPLELMLIALCVVVFARRFADARPVSANPFALPVGVLLAAVFAWMVFGMLGGGAMNIALWEIRALSYFCLLVFVVPLAVHTARDVRTVLWFAIGTLAIKIVQGIWNYLVVLGGDLSGARSVTSHEDALFIAWIVIFLLAMRVWRVDSKQTKVLLMLMPAAVVTFIVTDRRAAYAALVAGLVLLGVLVATDAQRRDVLVRVALPVVLAMVFIVGVGWQASGFIGAPAAVVRSIVAPDDKEDKESTLYRTAEEASLLRSIRRHPVLGLGFGRPFQERGTLIDIGFALSDVIPHNEVVWVWSKMGTVGFALFWSVMGGVIATAIVTFRKACDPYLKSVAALVACAVPMQLVVSYVDLQLTYARNMVFLGVLVGILAVLPRVDRAEAPLLEGGAR